MLHLAVNQFSKAGKEGLVIAHFDHGIRRDSHKDLEFVKNLAKDYGLKFISGSAKLGPESSESTARQARYSFLRQVMCDFNADKIVTAHHADDVVETMLINVSRGTKIKGLAPMSDSDSDVLRPLINCSKKQILKYAESNNLIWVEDVTNADQKYLRNKLRNKLASNPEKIDELLKINAKSQTINAQIQQLSIEALVEITDTSGSIIRSRAVVIPQKILEQYVAQWLRQNKLQNLNSTKIHEVSLAIKTLKPGKKLRLNKKQWIISQNKTIKFYQNDQV